MFLGFNFDPLLAESSFRQWIESGLDIDLEQIETQRACLANMLQHAYLLTDSQKKSIFKA